METVNLSDDIEAPVERRKPIGWNYQNVMAKNCNLGSLAKVEEDPISDDIEVITIVDIKDSRQPNSSRKEHALTHSVDDINNSSVSKNGESDCTNSTSTILNTVKPKVKYCLNKPDSISELDDIQEVNLIKHEKFTSEILTIPPNETSECDEVEIVTPNDVNTMSACERPMILFSKLNLEKTKNVDSQINMLKPDCRFVKGYGPTSMKGCKPKFKQANREPVSDSVSKDTNGEVQICEESFPSKPTNRLGHVTRPNYYKQTAHNSRVHSQKKLLGSSSILTGVVNDCFKENENFPEDVSFIPHEQLSTKSAPNQNKITNGVLKEDSQHTGIHTNARRLGNSIHPPKNLVKDSFQPSTSLEQNSIHPSESLVQNPSQSSKSIVKNQTIHPSKSTVQNPMQPSKSTEQNSIQHSKSTVQNTIHPFKSTAQNPIHPSKSTAQNPIQPSKNTVQNPIQSSKSTAQNPIQPSTSIVQNPIHPSTSTVQNPIQPSKNTVQNPIQPSKSSVQNPIHPSTSTVKNAIQPSTSTGQNPIQPSTSTVKNPIPPSTSTVQNTIQPSKNTVQNTIQPSKNTVQNSICPSTSTEKNPIQPSTSTVQNTIQPSKNTVQNTIQPSKNTVQNSICPSTSTVKNPIQPSTSTVQNTIQPSKNTVKNSICTSTSTVQNPIHPSTSTVQNRFQPSTSTVQNSIQPFKSIVQNPIQPFTSIVHNSIQPSKSIAQHSILASNRLVQNQPISNSTVLPIESSNKPSLTVDAIIPKVIPVGIESLTSYTKTLDPLPSDSQRLNDIATNSMKNCLPEEIKSSKKSLEETTTSLVKGASQVDEIAVNIKEEQEDTASTTRLKLIYDSDEVDVKYNPPKLKVEVSEEVISVLKEEKTEETEMNNEDVITQDKVDCEEITLEESRIVLRKFTDKCISFSAGDLDGAKILKKVEKAFDLCHETYITSRKFIHKMNLAIDVIDPKNQYTLIQGLYEVLRSYQNVPYCEKEEDPNEWLRKMKKQENASTSEVQDAKDIKIQNKLKKIEQRMIEVSNKIKNLQTMEVDWDDEDDSSYIQEDNLKKYFVKLDKMYCKLAECQEATGRPQEKKFRYEGSRYPEINRRITAWVNKNKEFPDFVDILKLVKKVTKDNNLPLRPEAIRVKAQEIFHDVGEILIKRRKKDDSFSILAYAEDEAAIDPAKNDVDLKAKLDSNAKTAKENLNQVFETFLLKEAELGQRPTSENAFLNIEANVAAAKTNDAAANTNDAAANTNDDEDDDVKIETPEAVIDLDTSSDEEVEALNDIIETDSSEKHVTVFRASCKRKAPSSELIYPSTSKRRSTTPEPEIVELD